MSELMEILAHVAQMPAVWAAVAVVAVLFALILAQPRRPRAIVSGLFVYPVKGLAGQRITTSEFDQNGFLRDRRYMVVRVEADGPCTFQHQRVLPQMAAMSAEYTDNGIRLTAGGRTCDVPLVTPESSGAVMRRVRVWDCAFGGTVDQGDEVAQFLCDFLRTFNLRLVHMPTSCVRPVPSKFKASGTANTTSFADGFPFLLLSEESLEGLRQRTSLALPDTRRFRPNIVISGAPFPNAEDRWPEITINGFRFVAPKKCTRCKVTTINPDNPSEGDPAADPLKTFKTYRLEDDGDSVCFGTNLIPRWSSKVARARPTLSVGAEVVVESFGYIPYK